MSEYSDPTQPSPPRTLDSTLCPTPALPYLISPFICEATAKAGFTFLLLYNFFK